MTSIQRSAPYCIRGFKVIITYSKNRNQSAIPYLIKYRICYPHFPVSGFSLLYHGPRTGVRTTVHHHLGYSQNIGHARSSSSEEGCYNQSVLPSPY